MKIYSNYLLILGASVGLMWSCQKIETEQERVEYKRTSELRESNPSPEPQQVELEQVEFRHPLRGVEPVNGKIPGFDLKDSPNGKRYAISEGVRSDHEDHFEKHSGVIEVESRPSPYKGRKKLTGKEAVEKQRKLEPVKISARLRSAVDESTNDHKYLTVLVRLDEPESHGNIMYEMRKAIAYGRINTLEDKSRERIRIVEERQSRIAELQAPIVRNIEDELGGSVIHRCENSYCLSVLIRPSRVEQLLEIPGIKYLGLSHAKRGTNTITADEVARGSQITQFNLVSPFYDGEYIYSSSFDDITGAVIEIGNYNDEHPVFKEGSGSSTRIKGRYHCEMMSSSAMCNSLNDFPDSQDGNAEHATAIAGLMFGDLLDGQDPSVTSFYNQRNRSGYSPESSAYLYRTSSSATDPEMIAAFDHMIALPSPPSVLNSTITSIPRSTTPNVYSDDDCMGTTALSQSANDLFEQGILLIQSAGNIRPWETPYVSANNCMTKEPANAIGVFTVTGHGASGCCTGNEANVRSDGLGSYALRGGASYFEGRYRSIIDISAYGKRSYQADTFGAYSGDGSGTSISTPTVAGAALNFIDFYKQEYSSLIDEPGMLFAHLLLAGDRQGDGFISTSRFSNLWGAGRLKMRKYNGPGMDYPWVMRNGMVCVDDGQTVTVDQFLVNSDTNDLKAVIYWYDSKHETGVDIDDIDLYLKDSFGSVIKRSNSSWDNKEMVYSSNVGGRTVRLEIDGFHVTGSTPACGPNSQLVYWALFAEDDDRDDNDGPSASFIAPEL